MLKRIIAALTLCTFLTGCTAQELALAENFINLGAVAVPVFTGLDPVYVNLIDTGVGYMDNALANPSQATYAQTAGQLGQLILNAPPVSAEMTPQQKQAWQNFITAAQTFIANYKTTTSAISVPWARSWVEPGKRAKHFKISKNDQKHIDELRAKIRALRSQIKQVKATK